MTLISNNSGRIVKRLAGAAAARGAVRKDPGVWMGAKLNLTG